MEEKEKKKRGAELSHASAFETARAQGVAETDRPGSPGCIPLARGDEWNHAIAISDRTTHAFRIVNNRGSVSQRIPTSNEIKVVSLSEQ